MVHESDVDNNCNWCAWYRHQRIGAGNGGLENKRMAGDHPNYSIIKIGQNTEKSPGDLRRLAVTQIPVRNYRLKLVRKTLKGVNNNNNNNNNNNETMIHNKIARVCSIDQRIDGYSHDDDHHHDVVSLARISLTLSNHFSLSFIASGRSSGLHPVSSHSWLGTFFGEKLSTENCSKD